MQNSAGTWIVRLFAFGLIAAGAALGIKYGHNYTILEFGSVDEKLQLLWAQDVEKLKASGKLPSGWDDIKEIQLIPATDNAKLWLKKVQVPIALKSSGHFKMEVLVVSWEEPKAAGVIVQYNLVDLKTNNMIWELGRTFTLKGQSDDVDVQIDTVTPTIPRQLPKNK